MTCACGQFKYQYDDHCIDCKPGKLPVTVKGQLNRIKAEIDRLMKVHPVPYADLLQQYALYESTIKIHLGEVTQ